jgi:ubiquinone/menaquinone biosynthesis C-methylase UbiE
MNTVSLHHNVRSVGAAYYDGPELLEGLLGALRDAGLDPDQLTVDDLAPLDEFHALGRPATIALAQLAAVTGDDHILDVGAGIGGPARFLAARYGARVTALDTTPRFLRIAEALTKGTGLAHRVRIVEGDALALPFDDGSFDVVWTQAVAQNIADKRRFIAELARVVAPGGRIALFELVAEPGGPLEFPVPWADGPEQSWIAPAAELRALLSEAELGVREWREGQDALATIAEAAQAEPVPATAESLGLQLLMPDYDARMAGLARNVESGRIALVQIMAERPR